MDLSGELLALNNLTETFWLDPVRAFEDPFHSVYALAALDLEQHAFLLRRRGCDARLDLGGQVALADQPRAKYAGGVLRALRIEHP